MAHAALTEGGVAFRGGHFEAAEQRWTEAAEAAARGGDAASQSDALRGRAQSQQARGAYADSLASLREAQNYVRAYTRGLGIFELPEYLAWPDWGAIFPILAGFARKVGQ